MWTKGETRIEGTEVLFWIKHFEEPSGAKTTGSTGEGFRRSCWRSTEPAPWTTTGAGTSSRKTEPASWHSPSWCRNTTEAGSSTNRQEDREAGPLVTLLCVKQEKVYLPKSNKKVIRTFAYIEKSKRILRGSTIFRVFQNHVARIIQRSAIEFEWCRTLEKPCNIRLFEGFFCHLTQHWPKITIKYVNEYLE